MAAPATAAANPISTQVLAPSKTHSSAWFSISKLISRVRSKHAKREKGDHETPYIDPRPPLIPSLLPLVLPQHQHTLPQLGWTTITFPHSQIQPSTATTTTPITRPSPPQTHPLHAAATSLFAAAETFFELPTSEKSHYKTPLNSEEGWSHIAGEKEFITLRTLANTPDVLRSPAQTYWNLMGAHLDCTLGRISTSLALPDAPDAGLRQFVGPCKEMPAAEADKTATMLRIFRYEGDEAKVVAEPHADLGLLSAVVGDVPGLEVWDGRGWFEVEKGYERLQGTMLAGRQLERLGNGRIPAGGHRVMAYGRKDRYPAAAPSSTETVPNYRHSIVFVLRAHEPVPISSSALETHITGKWAEPLRGVTAGELYKQILGKHFNINIGHEEREKQRRKVRERKEQLGKTEQKGSG